MVFQKADLGGYDLTLTCLWLLDKNSPDLFTERGRNYGRSSTCPILNICILFGDICCQSIKSFEFVLNLACFWSLKFFWVGFLKILDLDYIMEHTFHHGAKFRSDWPMELGDLTIRRKRIIIINASKI